MSTQNQTVSPSFIGLPAAAHDVSMSLKTLQNWIVKGRFPVATVKIGDRRLIPAAEWEAWKASLVAGTAAPVPPPAAPEPGTQKRGRGRPRKIAQGQGAGEVTA